MRALRELVRGVSWAARLGWVLVVGSVACDRAPELRAVEGAFGVFYGGQVQELSEVRVSVARPPVLGFRVEFQDAASEHQLRFEIIRPGPSGRRVTEVGEALVPSGQARFDRRLELGSDTTYGTWNVRVTCDQVVVIDRAMLLVREP